MGDFAANINLSSLDGTNGFRIDGQIASFLGRSVAGAGDLNGDGFADVLFSHYGSAYVLFGRSAAFSATQNLTTIIGTDGFDLPDFMPGDGLGISAAGVMDFNGDGIQDLIVGSPHTDGYGSASGSVYVIFGRQSGLPTTLTSAYLDGANGFAINGLDAGDWLGWSARSAGDVNGDGFDDVIVGARYAESGGYNTGAAYVIFGRDNGIPANMNVSTLDGTNGFRISGATPGISSRFQATGAGDINGDGFDDLAVSQSYTSSNGVNSGSVFVVFGKANGFGAQVNFADLTGANGFQITGERNGQKVGTSIANAGDINGDGIDDLIVGATEASITGGFSGAVWVVFGSASGFPASFSLSTLNGTNGFQINGVNALDRVGTSVSAAGDINGDGIGDLIVGAPAADPDGVATGAAYVIFGRTAPFSAVLTLTSLDGTNGFRITGALNGDGAGNSVSAAGDVNGDGIDDLIVAARSADPNGSNTGSVYIIYGHRVAETFVGGAGDETASGSSLADDLSGGGGKDTLYGLGGDDVLDGGDANDKLYGGDGADDLIGGLGGDILLGEAGDDHLDGGNSNDKLFGGAGSDDLTGGIGNDSMFGDDDNDTLTGNSGNDQLNGGTGADIMTGGADNDVYIVDNIGDQTIELADEGYDIVRSDITWTLDANIEGLQLQGSADIEGTGNALANNIQGNTGSNRLDGGAGVDNINGNDGDDFIIGGLGNDLLTGGGGADTFIVAHAFGPTVEVDRIYDFDTAEGDVLDLSGAYAGTLSLVSGFTKQAGEMTLSFSAGTTLLRLDIDGDGKADYQMKINGDVTGDSGGWLL